MTNKLKAQVYMAAAEGIERTRLSGWPGFMCYEVAKEMGDCYYESAAPVAMLRKDYTKYIGPWRVVDEGPMKGMTQRLRIRALRKLANIMADLG